MLLFLFSPHFSNIKSEMVFYYFIVHRWVRIILLPVWKVEFLRIRCFFFFLPVRFILVILFSSHHLWHWDCLFHYEETTQPHLLETTWGAFPVTWFLWMVHSFKEGSERFECLVSSSFIIIMINGIPNHIKVFWNLLT